MTSGDRVLASAVSAACFMLIVIGSLLFVSWERPAPMIFLIPGAILTIIALHNVAQRQ